MPLGTKVRLSPGDSVRWGPTLSHKKGGAPSPIFGPCLLLSPDCCMDQDGTWHVGRPWSSPHCARWGHSSPPQKGGRAPIFVPSLLWPNGWMHQDATWYGGRPQPRRLCVRRGPSPCPKRGGAPPNFRPRLLWPNGCMDQDATWYGGRPWPTRHCVRCGPSYRQKKGHTNPTQFLAHVHSRPSQQLLSPCFQMVAKRPIKK